MKKINWKFDAKNVSKSRSLRKTLVLMGVFAPLVALPMTAVSMSSNSLDSSAKAIKNDGSVSIAKLDKSSNTTFNEVAGETTFTINKLFNGMGMSASQAASKESRPRSDSNFVPFGYYVKANVPVTINVDNVLPGTYIMLGQYGPYKDINGGLDKALVKIPLNQTTVTFTPAFDGMLHIANESNYALSVNSIKGAAVSKLPLFIKDETSVSDFIQEVQTTDSAFVELVGDNTFMSVETTVAKKAIEQTGLAGLNSTLRDFDLGVQYAREANGLSVGYDGLAKKSGHKTFYVTNSTASGNAFAFGDHLRMQGGYGLSIMNGQNLRAGSWGFWHEIGHTFQQDVYTWDSMLEVTCNITALYVSSKFGMPYRTQNVNQTKAYFEKPQSERVYDSGWDNRHMQAGLWWQLHLAFGDSFLPTLNQAYRILSVSEKPTSSMEEEQLFMVMASKVAQRNLVNYFKMWGMPITDATIAKIYALGFYEPSKNIQDNLIQPTRIVENEVQTYAPTNNISHELQPIPLGHALDTPVDFMQYYTNPESIQRIVPNYLGLIKVDGLWTIPVKKYLKTPGKTDNFFNDTQWTDMSTGVVKFVGSDNKLAGYLGIDPLNHLIHFTSNNVLLDSASPSAYMGTIELKDAKGQLVFSLTCVGGHDFNYFINNLDIKYGLQYVPGETLEINWTKSNQVSNFNKATNDFDAPIQGNSKIVINL